MCAKNFCIRCVLFLAMATGMAACNRAPAVSPPSPVEVVVSQPVKEHIEDWDTYTGLVEARESVEVRSRVRGQIMKVLFTDGDEVKKDQPLFVIDDSPFRADLKQAKGQLETWQAKLKAAEEKIAIYKPLADKGTVSKEELVQAYGAKGEALGGIETAKGKIMEANTNIKYSNIVAAITGKISEALLTQGNIVNPGNKEALLTTIISVDPLYVYFYVNQRALETYQELRRRQFEKDKKKGKMDLPVEMALVNDSGFPRKGVLDFIDNKLDATGSVKVRARFENPKGADGLRTMMPGMFARVRIAVADPYPATLVTDRAILSDQSLKYVLVVNKAKDNVVERVDVKVSNRVQDNGLRQVEEEGLKGDEWVIVEGVNRARPGVTVNPKEAKMPRRAEAGNQKPEVRSQKSENGGQKSKLKSQKSNGGKK